MDLIGGKNLVAERHWKLAGDDVPGKSQLKKFVPEGTVENRERELASRVLSGRATDWLS